MYGTCEHHLVPFIGVAHIGYIPNVKGQITGLSKLARLVDVYARRPQVQERMTSRDRRCPGAASLDPRGVVVVIECRAPVHDHARGAQAGRASTVTSAVRGIFRRDARARSEAMSLLFGSR